MTHFESIALERLVDKYSIAEILQTLSIIAIKKSDHILHNWQDDELARAWHKIQISLDFMAERMSRLEGGWTMEVKDRSVY